MCVCVCVCVKRLVYCPSRSNVSIERSLLSDGRTASPQNV